MIKLILQYTYHNKNCRAEIWCEYRILHSIILEFAGSRDSRIPEFRIMP